MKTTFLGNKALAAPVIAQGCMRIDAMELDSLTQYLRFCIEHGVNFFDHADIYGAGMCESVFAQALKRSGYQRSDVLLQSKCGICPGVMYDFSKSHILESVDGILRRLNTDYLDVLLLHRPDALVETEEVAEAFDRLEQSGKVRWFGVSNHRPGQIELLKKYVRQNLVVNQVQFSIPFSNMIASGLEANMLSDGAVDRDGDILNYCRLQDITIQAWSPFQYGCFEGCYVENHEKFPKLNQVLQQLAEKYHTTSTAIAAAWILRHPAQIQLIAGTTSMQRMSEILQGSELVLERKEWYQLYLSAGHILP